MTTDFKPVFLGNGINAYSMARAFHEAYGVRSVMASRSLSALDTTSIIWDCVLEPDLDEPEVFLSTLHRIASEYAGYKLLLIGCADHYVRLIVTYREELKDEYIITYPGQDAMDKMVLKEDF
jgi:D-aspartate ligase